MFKERLTELRKKKGLSQYALAEQLGLSRGQISNYELGTREPDYITLIKIADYFNVTIDFLIGRNDEGSNPAQKTDAFEIIELFKGIRGTVQQDRLPLVLIEMAWAWAATKGIPLPPDYAPKITQKFEKDAQKELIKILDNVFESSDESQYVMAMAKEINNLTDLEKKAIKTMIEVLKAKNQKAATTDGPKVRRGTKTNSSLKSPPGPDKKAAGTGET